MHYVEAPKMPYTLDLAYIGAETILIIRDTVPHMPRIIVKETFKLNFVFPVHSWFDEKPLFSPFRCLRVLPKLPKS